MNKRILILALCLCVCVFALTGCGCKHENWKKADCENPRTCADCGETEGEPKGHDWNDATCEEPKTCDECGETEGDPLGHDWVEADCVTPKTCADCGETEGEALGHALGNWEEIDLDTEKRVCENCDYSEEQAIDRQAKLMEILTGTWELEGLYMEDGYYFLDEFTYPESLYSYFVFGDDGSMVFNFSDTDYDMEILSSYGVEYEYDAAEEYGMYSWIMTEGVDYYTTILFDEADGTQEIWFALDEDWWVYVRTK